MKARLPRAKAEGLGRPTIMNRALAAEHGAIYVHLAVFAIDVDRVRDALEDLDDPLPFAWEVFLTEAWLVAHVAKDDAAHASMLEDAVLSVIDGEPDALGAQLPFAVWDAIVRGALPASMRAYFSSWKGRPDELVKSLAPLFADEARHRAALAAVCLDAELDPPLAPPTIDALRAMSGRAQ